MYYRTLRNYISLFGSHRLAEAAKVHSKCASSICLVRIFSMIIFLKYVFQPA